MSRVGELVESVGRSLAPPPTVDYQQYRFFVLRDPSPNAFALPNGDIYIHTGMLARLTDTAELAAVLGHELNHVAGHHGVVDLRANTKKIIAGMEQRKREVVMSAKGKLGRWLKLLAPAMVDRMAMKALKKEQRPA